MYVCIWYVHVVIYETATHLIFDLDFGPTFLCVCVLSWDFIFFLFCLSVFFSYRRTYTHVHTKICVRRNYYLITHLRTELLILYERIHVHTLYTNMTNTAVLYTLKR